MSAPEDTGPHPPLSRRGTPDLIVLALTGIVGFVLIAGVVGSIVWEIADPGASLDELAKRIGDITNTLIGAIVGYLAGRGALTGSPLTSPLTRPPSEPPDGGEEAE